VVAHGHKQVEEEFAAASLHLSLHGAAALKGLAAADDQGEDEIGTKQKTENRKKKVEAN